MRILLIEDDVSLCKALVIHLNSQGYETDVCHNGTDGLSYALQNAYDVIILDRMLPELDGLTLLSAIRRKNIFTPVIITTAMDSVQDKINGLDCGADDYITKPFDAQELLARIRALSRRPAVLNDSPLLSYGDLSFNPEKQELSVSQKTLSLSKKEAGLMEYLLKNKEQNLRRNLILSYVWGADAEVEEGNLDNYIYFLRRRLRTLKSNVQIKTIHGVGYRLEEKSDEAKAPGEDV